MDKVIYDDNMENTMKLWLQVAEYTKIKSSPFEEIEIIFKDIKNVSTSIIYKKNRIIYKMNRNKQTTKIELKDGEYIPTRVTYSDFRNNEKKVAEFSVSIINTIFGFVCNYNLPQNESFQRIYKMEKILKGEKLFTSRKNNQSIKQEHKTKMKEANKSQNLYFADLINATNSFQYSNGGETREYTRHSEGWSVKGYMRKKPKGGYTWVHPHTRGNKANKKDKIYKL